MWEKNTCIVIKITFIKENNKKIIKQKISQRKGTKLRETKKEEKKKANHEKVSSWGGTSSWRKDWCLITRTIGNILQPKTGVFEESFTRSLNLSLPVSDSWGPIEPKRAAWHYQGNGIWWRKENGSWGLGKWVGFCLNFEGREWEKKWGFWVCCVWGEVFVRASEVLQSQAPCSIYTQIGTEVVLGWCVSNRYFVCTNMYAEKINRFYFYFRKLIINFLLLLLFFFLLFLILVELWNNFFCYYFF